MEQSTSSTFTDSRSSPISATKSTKPSNLQIPPFPCPPSDLLHSLPRLRICGHGSAHRPPPQSADFLGQSLQRGSSHSLRLILSSLAIIATIILFLVLFVLSASTCVYLTLLKLCLSLRVKHLVSQFSWLLRSTLLSNLTWSMDTIPISAALDQLKSSRNTSVH